jgi:predicted MPP superfamily phosphohydrolase
MKRRKKRRTLVACLALALAALVGWAIWSTYALQYNEITVESDNLPQSFVGYRIAHISDLHNARFGENNERLLTMLRDAQPDIIAITGDMIDSRKTNVRHALAFAEEAVKIAPCYYVTGNHEARVPQAFSQLESGLQALGVTVLRNEKVVLERNGEQILLLGLDDPGARTQESVRGTLQALLAQDERYAVLLAHRPELFEIYAQSGVDLALSGHAHGGQIRLPFIGAVAAPNQGFFPKYAAGLFREGATSMFVSRGLGNSIIPFRFGSRPELALIILS